MYHNKKMMLWNTKQFLMKVKTNLFRYENYNNITKLKLNKNKLV